MATTLTKEEIYAKALELIAADALPCTLCKESHEYRKVGGNFYTWSHPDDGHSYIKMDVQTFILRVLEGDWVPDTVWRKK